MAEKCAVWWGSYCSICDISMHSYKLFVYLSRTKESTPSSEIKVIEAVVHSTAATMAHPPPGATMIVTMGTREGLPGVPLDVDVVPSAEEVEEG